jgi:erythromycin esterase
MFLFRHRAARRSLTLLIGISPIFFSSVRAQEATPQTLSENTPVVRDLKGNEVHEYLVDVAAGGLLRVVVDQRGIDVVVRAFALDGTRLAEVDSPNGDQGPEPVEIMPKVAGAYRIEVASLDPASPPGKYQIKIDEHLTAAAYAARLAAELRRRTETIAWLKQNAIPIKTVEAGNGFADLQPLKRILRDVRLVGLGEETHGTREFFQFKHRMVEFLVREMGFRVFAIEASYAGCRNINDYIQGRTTDGAGALASQTFWTWNTEEVRSMMEWMRAYNAAAPADQKLKFVGFDLQWNREARDTVLAYLKRVAPERADAFAALTVPQAFNASDAEAATSLETLTEAAVGGSPEVKATALKKVNEIRAAYLELIGFLAINETKFALKTSATEFADALHSARMVPQYLDAYLVPIPPGPQDLALRDLHMAENMAHFVAAEPAGTRFIIWAHNFHVGSPVDSPYRFGARLRALYGAQYYNVGFSFGEGGFQSRSFAGPKPTRTLTGFTVGPPPEGSLDWYLGQTGSKLFWIDLRHAPTTGTVAEWAKTPLPMRSIGSIYAPEGDAGYYSPIVPRQEFDGLFFINRTTRARPNPGIKNVAPITN